MISQKIEEIKSFNWRDQVKRSKIKRINYKEILGVSLTKYILDNRYKKNNDLVYDILCKIKRNSHLIFGWKWEDVVKNVKISVSARRAEQAIYNH